MYECIVGHPGGSDDAPCASSSTVTQHCNQDAILLEICNILPWELVDCMLQKVLYRV